MSGVEASVKVKGRQLGGFRYPKRLLGYLNIIAADFQVGGISDRAFNCLIHRREESHLINSRGVGIHYSEVQLRFHREKHLQIKEAVIDRNLCIDHIISIRGVLGYKEEGVGLRYRA